MLEQHRNSDLSLVTPRQVLTQLGAAPDGLISARSRRIAERAASLIDEHARVDTVVRVEELEAGSPFPALTGGRSIRSRKIGRALRGCTHAAVFVVTLGDRVDELVAEAMDRRPHLGVVLDAAASVAAEGTVARLTAELQESLPEGHATTPPFSPGYCDWPLAEQAILFESLPDEPAGVTLSEASLMRPRKSVAGVLGIGDEALLREHGIPCRRCARTDCDHRRAPYRRAD